MCKVCMQKCGLNCKLECRIVSLMVTVTIGIAGRRIGIIVQVPVLVQTVRRGEVSSVGLLRGR